MPVNTIEVNIKANFRIFRSFQLSTGNTNDRNCLPTRRNVPVQDFKCKLVHSARYKRKFESKSVFSEDISWNNINRSDSLLRGQHSYTYMQGFYILPNHELLYCSQRVIHWSLSRSKTFESTISHRIFFTRIIIIIIISFILPSTGMLISP